MADAARGVCFQLFRDHWEAGHSSFIRDVFPDVIFYRVKLSGDNYFFRFSHNEAHNLFAALAMTRVWASRNFL